MTRNNRVPMGQVVGTNPGAGTGLKSGSTVEIIVSAGVDPSSTDRADPNA